ncbi:permease [Haliangium ochraceum]|uniref:Permease n=1 Tax=Haliangium ochraceum (strain DSM 14365 / JCM 11303 / SMP-2) TaxID=502025 RepID=D0LUH5_HALO1|nr:permease [Haliangium ochraceum]ACY19298.1 permease [Haliangium ochraceum DSM 14365]
MFLLVTSVLALAIGPVLYRAAGAARWALSALDGFIMVAVAGLVVVHIVPHSVALAGPWALGLALLGFLGPGMIERYLHRAARTTHLATLVLACIGLMAHALFDGAALGSAAHGHGHDHEGSLLAIAVVLHRLPVGVTIWWLLRPASGLLVAAATLTGLGVATVAGYGLAGALAAHMDAAWVGMLQCLVAGSLLHVVVHRPPPVALPASTSLGRWLAGIGALIGGALVVSLSDTHLPAQGSEGEMFFNQTFLALALESAPALLLGFVLAGLLKVYLPHLSLRWMRSGRPSGEALRGMAFGLPLPICSCGVVPVYRSLIAAGVPTTAAMAFLVATPELGIDAILLSLPLLGGKLTLARVLAAALVAFVVGVLVGRWARSPSADAVSADAETQAPSGSRLAQTWQGIRFGLTELLDDVGPWLLLGLIIASLVEPLVEGAWFAALPEGLDVVLGALLGMPTYVCASGATPFVAVLLHKGISPGAALAFLLAGPATNITTFGILAKLHGRRIAIAFAAVLAGLAIAVGLAANALIGPVDTLPLHASAHESPSLLAMSSLAILAAMFALSLIRQGPRGFLGHVLAPLGSDDCHDHDHGHGHGHGHDHAHDRGTPAPAAEKSCCGGH